MSDNDKEPVTSVGKATEDAWNQIMGSDSDELPSEDHFLTNTGTGEIEDAIVIEDKPKTEQNEQQDTGTQKDETAGDDQTKTTDESALPESTEAPKHWSAEDRAVFEAQTPEAKAFLLKRHREMEADYTRKTQENAANRNLGKVVSESLSPEVKQMLPGAGMTEETFVKSLIDWHRLSLANPKEFLKQAVKNMGVDPATVFDSPAGKPTPKKDEDPTTKRIAAIEQTLAQTQEQANRQIQEHATNQINAFADETNEKGEPLRPHFAAVRDSMARLMMADDSMDLQRAYEVAVYANPELRSSLMETSVATPQTVDTKRVKEAEKAAKASKANIRGSGTGAQTPKGDGKPKSLRESLAEAADEVGMK